MKTRFIHGGRGRSVLLELDGGGKIVTRNITMPGGQLLASMDGSKPRFYHFDALGSTLAVTNDKARVTARYEYDPYGSRRSHPATDERYGFVGQEWVKDEPSGLMEMGVRFYDPGTGRFVSMDPLKIAGMPLWACYSYAWNNPIGNTDPRGLHHQNTDYAERSVDGHAHTGISGAPQNDRVPEPDYDPSLYPSGVPPDHPPPSECKKPTTPGEVVKHVTCAMACAWMGVPLKWACEWVCTTILGL